MEPAGKKARCNRAFEWSTATFGQYLLKIAYNGENYSGLAWQPSDSGDSRAGGTGRVCRTVEGMLFDAMKKTCCIRDRASSGFSRCGRTDKGVHAAGNYICVRMRRKPGPKNEGEPDDYDYARILNAVLPKDIRIVGVCRVGNHFDARFQCLYRVYKYFFVGFGLDVDVMRTASQQFVGNHDFRNFCKIDAARVRHFRRTILWVKIRPVMGSAVWEIEIAGLSFLWHQIRCMVAILFLIGKGVESSSIIPALLDVERCPRKPTYELASEASLVLYDCFFEGLHFPSSSELHLRNIKAFKEAYSKQLALTAVLQCLSCSAEVSAEHIRRAEGALDTDAKDHDKRQQPLQYTPLLKRRTTAESLETKREKAEERRLKKQREKEPSIDQV